ncbi:MAG TPA: plastocyanin/azurin family copper-binding protein [Acidimicrobiia bacterium]|nr:plastocyanin/azurin family copper-binding protein [Acidimicrobiia bacterium]
MSRPTTRRLGGGAIVALLAAGACHSGSGSKLAAVTGPTAPRLELNATEMRYTPSTIAVAAGDVAVVLHNTGVVPHDLRIEGQPRLGLEATPKQTGTATWHLAKGRYRIYCSVPGHRAAGMEGVLEVR